MRRAMTCVYCEPKSRMRIFECADGAEVFTLRMSLRHAVLCRGIAGRPLDRTERSLAGDAALKLPSYFFRAALFDRVSAAACDQHPCDHEQDRHASHLLILESRRCKASVVAVAVSAALAIRWRLAKAPLQHQGAAVFRKKGVESDAFL